MIVSHLTANRNSFIFLKMLSICAISGILSLRDCICKVRGCCVLHHVMMLITREVEADVARKTPFSIYKQGFSTQ